MDSWVNCLADDVIIGFAPCETVITMKEIEVSCANHQNHALEWQTEDTCILCLVEIVRSSDGQYLKVHRRFALSAFIQRLNPDPASSLNRALIVSQRNLSRLLQKSTHVSSTVIDTLLCALSSTDVVDLAVEALYRLYYHACRDDLVLEMILNRCQEKVSQHMSDEQKESMVPYLSVMQRLARLDPAAVKLALLQNSKLEALIVEHLSDSFSDFVALHVIALLDPILRSTEGQGLIIPARQPFLMIQLARLLTNTNCRQLQYAALGLDHLLWTKMDLRRCATQDRIRQELLILTVHGLKRIILTGSLEFQLGALQVLDALLWQCGQQDDAAQMGTVLLEQELAELVYDVLYTPHDLCLLEYALRCLHHLSRCPAFFQHRCIILGVEPLLRVIPHLMESSGSKGLITACAVHLLSDILAKYEGEESLLARITSEENGFHLATRIAVGALKSSELHLETSGAFLVAALLCKKNVPIPFPLDIITGMIESIVKYLAPQQKKWKSETGRYHLQALVKVLTAVTSLVNHSLGDPRALLSSYSTAESMVGSTGDEAKEKLIVLVLETVERLFSAFHQIDQDILWPDLFHLLLTIASCGGEHPGAQFVERAAREGGLLKLAFRLRERCSDDVPFIREGAEDFLTWCLGHSLRGALPSQSPFETLKSLVRSIPIRTSKLGEWISRDPSCPFASKCIALILLYQLEMLEEGEDAFVEQGTSDSVLSSIGDLILTRNPSDLDDPDLLRALWFLIAKYSRTGVEEASSAFLHLIKWFRPNGATLPTWLRRIYTPHQCLMRWTFAVKDIALYLGPVVVLLWISPDDGNENGKRDADLVRFCLEKNDDESLLLSIFDLVFSEETNVSIRAVSILERVTVLGNGILREVISRTIKYNIPRFLRLTDPSDSTINGTDLARLTGSLRLLCHLSTLSISTEWKDPSISGALVSFLPRTISAHLVEQDLRTVTLPTLDLWSWSFKYLTAVVENSREVSVQIVMGDRRVLEFLDTLFRRDELPIWKDAAALVAALASLAHSNQLEVVSCVHASTVRLVKKLTDALIANEEEAADDAETVSTLFRLLASLLRSDFRRPAFLIDPSIISSCNNHEGWIRHLWLTLQNWTLRIHPSGAAGLFTCLTELIRFCRRSLPSGQFSALVAEPWNYRVALHGLESHLLTESRPQALELTTEILAANQSNLQLYGPNLWSIQLEEALKECSVPSILAP